MANQRVLIIDDSQDIHRLVRARLKGLSVDIDSASSAAAGLDKVREQMPDLILLDVNMPGISGFEACEQLKNNPITHDIPVIFLTGVEESVNKVKGFDLGAVDYVTKPFDPAELRARVRTALKTKTLMDMLTSQAQLDGLTGLHNRRYFDDRIKQALDTVTRYKHPVGLLLLDVDHFKSINDTFGHPKGDQVLCKLAELLTQNVRVSDVACRYGGEEFAVILPDSSPDHTFQSGQRLLELVRNCTDFLVILNRPVTVSIGTACAEPSASITPQALINQADQALYAAKASGRNRVEAA